MHRKFALPLALGLLLCVASALEAQEQGQRGRGGQRGARGGGGAISRTALLNVEAVQKELELSDDQTSQLEELRDAARRERSGEGDAEGGQRRGRGGAGRGGASPEQVQEEVESLSEILLDHQMKRLTEIYVQVAGMAVLRDPVIAKELKITDEQRQAMQDVQAGMRDRMREAFESSAGDQEAMRQAMAEMRTEIDQEIMDELTADQQEMLEDLKGEPFEMPADALRRGRGGRGGGRTDF